MRLYRGGVDPTLFPSAAFTIIQGTAGTTILADSVSDTLSFVSGDSSVSITTDATTDTIDIRALTGGNSFTTINTPSGTSPVADSSSDTLTLSSNGSSLVITGDATGDSINFDIDLPYVTSYFWALNGNSGSPVASGFFGTTDDQDIVIKRNNTLFGKIATEGFSAWYASAPQAAIHAGAATITQAAATGGVASFSLNSGTSGYSLSGGGTNYYDVYAQRTVNGNVVYSSALTIGGVTMPSSGSDFEASSGSANVNLAGSGYTESGQTINYTVYAVYGGTYISPTGLPLSVTFDFSGSPCSVDVSWFPPVITADNLTGYLVVNTTSNTYTTTGSIGVTDDATWGPYFGATTVTNVDVNLSWTASALADQYIVNNSTYTRYSSSVGTTITDDASMSWNSGTPTTTPTSVAGESLRSEGDTQLVKNGTGRFSIFGATPQTQQTGDIGTALSNYGLVTSPTIAATSVTGTLPVANGGTGTSSMATNLIPYYDGSTLNGQKLWSSNGGIAVSLSTGGLGVIHAHRPASADAQIWITNSVTGSSGTAGLNFTVDTSGNAIVNQRGNFYLSFLTNNAERMRILAGGDIGMGTTAPSARLHLISTTSQQRTGYDVSNYYSTTVGSTGAVTFDAVGSGAAFTFSDTVAVPDDAYAAGWNGSANVPTKNAVYDKIEAMLTGTGMPVTFEIAASDETTDLTTGTAKVTFRMPYAMTLTAVRASVNTAPTGSTIVVDINESGTTILSTKLSIDASEKTSTTAASAAVISDTALADDAEMTIDIDQIGSTIAGKGLKVTLIGNRV